MKPFKTLGSICLVASALILVTSCTKTIDEQSDKIDRDSEKLIGEGPLGGRCGRYIGMRLKDGNGTFWYETLNNAQDFSGNDWTTDMSLMKVTSFADGTVPAVTSTSPVYITPGENLGVSSDGDALLVPQEYGRINTGEVLRMELGTGFPGIKMYGFDLNLNASRDCAGVIRMYDGATLVATYTFSGVGRKVKNFSAIYRTPDGTFFTRMEFTTTMGAFRINGVYGSGNPLNQPDARFYVIDLPNQAYFNTDEKNPTNYPFMTSVIQGVPTDVANYQLRNAVDPGQPKSGEFTAGAMEWIKITGDPNGANQGLVYRSRKLAIWTAPGPGANGTGGETDEINPGETVTITAGDDLPFKFFRTFEVREAHETLPVNFPLEVKLWNGNTQVGGGLTQGFDRGYTPFYSNVDFDRITITGTGPGASIGRPSPVCIRLTKGCATAP